jgi:hypothetical protein
MSRPAVWVPTSIQRRTRQPRRISSQQQRMPPQRIHSCHRTRRHLINTLQRRGHRRIRRRTHQLPQILRRSTRTHQPSQQRTVRLRRIEPLMEVDHLSPQTTQQPSTRSPRNTQHIGVRAPPPKPHSRYIDQNHPHLDKTFSTTWLYGHRVTHRQERTLLWHRRS